MENAKDIISTLTPIEQNPTQNLYDSLKSAHIYEGTAVDKTVSHVQDEILKEFYETSVDSIYLEGEPEEGIESDNIEKATTSTKVLISEIAYFEKDVLKGYISLDDSKVYNMLNNKLKNIDLIPILSYIFLKGKCRYCGQKIRPRYLVLEILSGLVIYGAIRLVYKKGAERINVNGG